MDITITSKQLSQLWENRHIRGYWVNRRKFNTQITYLDDPQGKRIGIYRPWGMTDYRDATSVQSIDDLRELLAKLRITIEK